MPAMTMPYKFKEKRELDAVKPGDIVDGTLVIVENDAYLTKVTRIGEAPIEQAPPETTVATAASSGLDLLKPGDAVPDSAFVDQDGKKKTFRAFRGSRVVLTFIYTKCPIPTFCPMMDRHFATLQEHFQDDLALKDVHLVTVSFDPAVDTPPVLKKHARELKADLTRWTFLTGDRDDIDKFATRCGMSVARAPNDARDITHNLGPRSFPPRESFSRYYGQQWTPKDILEDLKPMANARFMVNLSSIRHPVIVCQLGDSTIEQR
jgi:protein SCO1/2